MTKSSILQQVTAVETGRGKGRAGGVVGVTNCPRKLVTAPPGPWPVLGSRRPGKSASQCTLDLLVTPSCARPTVKLEAQARALGSMSLLHIGSPAQVRAWRRGLAEMTSAGVRILRKASIW